MRPGELCSLEALVVLLLYVDAKVGLALSTTALEPAQDRAAQCINTDQEISQTGSLCGEGQTGLHTCLASRSIASNHETTVTDSGCLCLTADAPAVLALAEAAILLRCVIVVSMLNRRLSATPLYSGRHVGMVLRPSQISLQPEC